EAGMKIDSRYPPTPEEARGLGTEALRRHFLVETLFVPGEISLTYSHADRMILGGASPLGAPLALEPVKETGTAAFLDRRELVAVNIGGAGWVRVGDEAHALGHRDVLYIGMGAGSVRFESA